MAAGDATYIAKKGAAYRVYLVILDADGDLVTGAAGLDSEISKDGGTFTDCTNEATEIATSSGMYYLELTATEMNADAVCIIVKTSTSGAKTTPIVIYTAARDIDDLAFPTTSGRSIGVDANGGVLSGLLRTGTAQAGAAGNITLDAGASATDDFYRGHVVVILSGTGVGQARVITESQGGTAYNGATKVATVKNNWLTTPDATSVFAILSGHISMSAWRGALPAVVTSTGYVLAELSTAGVQAIWAALTSALTTAGSIGKLLVDNVNATISSRSSHAAADVGAVGERTRTSFG